MRNRFFNLIAVGLLFSVALSGCSSMTAQGRAQMKYRHMAQKRVKQRRKDVAKAQKAANRLMKKNFQPQPVGPPVVSSSVEQVPAEQAPAEQVAAPMAVSSNSGETTTSEPTP